jgi:hypothetical protein
MILRVAILLLGVVGPAQAQSMQEIFIQSEEARLLKLKEEAKALSERQPKSPEVLGQLRVLQLEIRRIDGRIRTLKENAQIRPPE